MKKNSIAVVDDESSICEMLAMMFEENGLNVETFTDPLIALKYSQKNTYDLFLVDLSMPNISGLEFLKIIKRKNLDAEIIMMSAYGTVENVKEMFKYQVFDFVEKPFNMEDLLRLVNDALEKVNRKKKITSDSEKNILSDGKSEQQVINDKIIGNSEKINAIINKTKKIASFDTTVLVTGETGTGKELIADTIYSNSKRKGHPFIKVNCPAIAPNLFESELFGYEKGSFTGAYKSSEGKFYAANGGIIFLDEIGDLPLDAQAKILRIIQNGELSRIGSSKVINVDVRIVVATNLDLKELVKKGKFREDLYYRLNQVSIHLPPLRERTDDIPDLVEYFSNYYSNKFEIKLKKIPEQILAVLLKYNWPGNIRELSNCVNRFYILAEKDIIEISDLPNEIRNVDVGYEHITPTLEDIEKAYIYYLLEKSNWDKKEVSNILGIDISTLYRKIARYNINEQKNDVDFVINLDQKLEIIEKAMIFYYIEYEHLDVASLAKKINVDVNKLKGKMENYEIHID